MYQDRDSPWCVSSSSVTANKWTLYSVWLLGQTFLGTSHSCLIAHCPNVRATYDKYSVTLS